jgi:hypothetical protein
MSFVLDIGIMVGIGVGKQWFVIQNKVDWYFLILFGVL